MRIALLPLSLVVLALGLCAASASASTAEQIIKDCSNSDTGLLKGSYSKADLRAARKLVRGDIAEYTGCADAINEALSQNGDNGNNGGNGSDGGDGSDGTGGGTGGGDGSGGFGDTGSGGSLGGDGSSGGLGSGGTSGGDGTTGAPTTGAGAAPAPTQQAGSGAPVAVGGEQITPGIPASFSSDQRALPTPLIVFLVLLAAGAIGFGAPTIGRRVLARRRG